MRLCEIKAPQSHPFLATLCVTPERFDELDFLIDGDCDARLLWIQNDEPQVHQFYVACRSDEVRGNFEARWG